MWLLQEIDTSKCLDCGTEDRTGKHILFSTNNGGAWVCPACKAKRDATHERKAAAAAAEVNEMAWRDEFEA